MPFDAYSLCPGGTHKKIKFCCPDFFPELEKIEHLLQGGQFAACVDHVERLQAQPGNQDKACLMAMKGDALLELGRAPEAIANAKTWVEKHPDNGDAHAELATLLALTEGIEAAMPHLQKALALCEREIGYRLVNALSVAVQTAQMAGAWMPVGPLTNMLMEISPDDPQWTKLRAAFTHNAKVPLPLRETPAFPLPPDDAPWRPRFAEAFAKMAKCSWQEALLLLDAVRAEAPESPAVWKAIAFAKGCLLDTAGCCEALDKYATLDVTMEDAVDAKTLRMIVSDDPLGDNVELSDVAWNVEDCDRLWEQILSSDRVMVLPPERFRTEEGAMPRGAFVVFDKAGGESSGEVAPDAVQCVLSVGLLYGRQTDRDARLELSGISNEETADIREWLERIAPGAVKGEALRDEAGALSRSVRMLRPNLRLPADWDLEKRRALQTDRIQDAFFRQWPQMKLGIFGGRSVAEAAAMPENRITALAAILYLKYCLDEQNVDLDLNPLRASLGLPLVEPIDASHAEQAFHFPSRLYRLKPESLSDEMLDGAVRLAYLYDLSILLPKFAKEMVSRPSFSGTPSQQRALQILAQTAGSAADALRYIDEGRKAAEAAGQPSGQWHLMEMYQRMGAGDAQGAQAVFDHVYRDHVKEPGVQEAIMRFLMDIGAIRPDGTPNPQFQAAAAQPAAAEPSGLWTPESQQPSSGGGGKLWVPD